MEYCLWSAITKYFHGVKIWGSTMCVQLLRCDNNGLNSYGKEGTNPVGQVAQATIFCTVATNICGPPWLNLRPRHFWGLEFWGCSQILGKCLHPWIRPAEKGLGCKDPNAPQCYVIRTFRILFNLCWVQLFGTASLTTKMVGGRMVRKQTTTMADEWRPLMSC